MKIPIHVIDAFAEHLFQGNPAAVCPLQEWLPDAVLQSIAAENNLSETAFYVENGDRYDLRWFTPKSEVDLCGHATLAAAHVLFATDCRGHDTVRFHSQSGPLKVLSEGDLLTLDFPARPGTPCPPPVELVEGLGQSPLACFTGTDFMAVYDSQATMAGLRPDFQKLAELDCRGIIVTAPGDTVDFVSRFFAPNYGILEDPVTGSAHCTLTPYWAERLGKTDLSARQLSERTGSLRCRLAGDRVLISGKTVPYLEGAISVNF